MGKPDDKDGKGGDEQGRELIDGVFRRGSEFAQELLKENERLRYRVVELEEAARVSQGSGKPGSSQATLRELASRVEQLEAERDALLNRFKGVEQQTIDFQQRFHDIERENNNLANLYVASYQLHSTLDLREVTNVILEILLNFVGAKTLAIQLVDEEQKKMRTLASDGIDRDRVPERGISEGDVGGVVSSGQPFYDEERLKQPVSLEKPAIVIPFKVKEKVVGVVIIWDLLVQKPTLADVDYELFSLISSQVGSALTAAKLSAEIGSRPAALWAAADLV